MANTKTNVLSNAATLLIGAHGGAATAVGYTRNGVTITKTYDTRSIEADQTRFPLYTQVTSEGYEINFRLMEITADNLKDGWGESATVGAGTLSLGVESDNPDEKVIKVYAKNKADQYVIFTFYDCVLASTGGLTYSRDEEALIEATFTALYDDDEKCCGLFEEDGTP